MDNYPEDFAPEFNEGGGVATPFEVWWPRVSDRFSNVPEVVAREWLHRHWRHSPYQWLRSASYRFVLVDWPSDQLSEIRSRLCNFEPGNNACREYGRHLYESDYWPMKFMRENSKFPTPIIVIDNTDGHLAQDYPDESDVDTIPSTFVLVEGHRRFDLGLYMASIGKLESVVGVWLMK